MALPSFLEILTGSATAPAPAKMRFLNGVLTPHDFHVLHHHHLPIEVKLLKPVKELPNIEVDQWQSTEHFEVIENSQGKPQLEATLMDADGLPHKLVFQHPAVSTELEHVLNVDDVRAKVNRINKETLAKKIDKVSELVTLYENNAAGVPVVGSHVRWRKGLQGRGMGADTIGQIVDPADEIDFAALRRERILNTGVLERYDCLVAYVDKEGDLDFFIADSHRLEVVSRPTLDTE